MIKKLQIKNFKSIKSLNINLRNLNLLCGENASGKTSIIHALLIALQSTKTNKNFDGDVIKIGGLSELRNITVGNEISIKVETEDAKVKEIILRPNEDIAAPNKDILVKNPVNDVLGISFEKQFFYLSSNRSGLADIYSKGNSVFGSSGEAAISYMSEHQDDLMPDEYMEAFKKVFPKSSINENRRYYEHVRFWVEQISSDVIKIEPVPYTNQYVLTFGVDRNVRPINTGSGYSYILPIIIMCLGSIVISKTPLIIIENPEIYLHPVAQRELAEFFLFISKFEQLIIETHSENILEAIIKSNAQSKQILVANYKDNYTLVERLTPKNFKTKPISYSEVLYKAFHIPSIELHVLLYGLMQEKCNVVVGHETKIKEFDNWLLSAYPRIQKKQMRHRNTIYETLPTYIRNCIDHPEGRSPSDRKYKFTEMELRKSIDFLLANL